MTASAWCGARRLPKCWKPRAPAWPMRKPSGSGLRMANWASISTICAKSSRKRDCAMSDGTRVMWMRGGTSKGGYFLASDLPEDVEERDAVLLRIMGSPDARQIDGMGGANPLTSKVAVVKPSTREGVDVDYLFLQVFVD